LNSPLAHHVVLGQLDRFLVPVRTRGAKTFLLRANSLTIFAGGFAGSASTGWFVVTRARHAPEAAVSGRWHLAPATLLLAN